MFSTISKAGIGMYVVVAITILRALGLDLDEGVTTEAVFTVLQGIGAILWIIGQLVRKDLSWGIFRRKE